MNGGRWKLGGLAGLALLASGVAEAHFALVKPPSAVATEDGGKGAPPCGEGTESNVVTDVQGGHPLAIQLSEFVALPYLKSGRLKEVLASARSSAVPVSIVYPHGRNASGATRTFVDLIAELFEQSDFKRGL